MEREYFAHHIWSRFRGLSTSQPRSNHEYLEDYLAHQKEDPEATRSMFFLLKILEDAVQVLDACKTRLRRARGLVRPGAARLLTGIECSRVRDSSWMYLTSLVNYPNRRRTNCSTRKLPDHVVVGLQLYSVRTFHVTLSPRIYKGGQWPPRNKSTPKAIQTITQNVGSRSESV